MDTSYQVRYVTLNVTIQLNTFSSFAILSCIQNDMGWKMQGRAKVWIMVEPRSDRVLISSHSVSLAGTEGVLHTGSALVNSSEFDYINMTVIAVALVDNDRQVTSQKNPN